MNIYICPECEFDNVTESKKYCPECGCPFDYIKKNQPNKIEKNTNKQNNKSSLKTLLNLYESIIILDTETSGLDFQKDEIIELSAVRIKLFNDTIYVASQFDELIKLPLEKKVSAKITEITGITDEILGKKGISKSDACAKFIELFTDKRILIVAYNAHFDLSFLNYFFDDQGQLNIFNKADILDALTVYKDRKPYPHKLENAISAYLLQNKVTNEHRAMSDVKATFEVLKAMDEELNDLHKYINLFGYNPKWGITGEKFYGIEYVPQYYNVGKRLYEQISIKRASSFDKTESSNKDEGKLKIENKYPEGMYKIGIDMPAGEYKIYTTQIDCKGYFCISSDANGIKIIANGNFKNYRYISLLDGQFLELTNCEIR